MTEVLFWTNRAWFVSVGVFDQVDTSSVLEGEGLIRVRSCGFSPPVILIFRLLITGLVSDL